MYSRKCCFCSLLLEWTCFGLVGVGDTPQIYIEPRLMNDYVQILLRQNTIPVIQFVGLLFISNGNYINNWKFSCGLGPNHCLMEVTTSTSELRKQAWPSDPSPEKWSVENWSNKQEGEVIRASVQKWPGLKSSWDFPLLKSYIVVLINQITYISVINPTINQIPGWLLSHSSLQYFEAIIHHRNHQRLNHCQPSTATIFVNS